MNSLFPDAYYDPQAVVIGLTPLDLPWAGKDWRYAFGVRGGLDDPKAVISSARMDPQSYGRGRDDDLFFSRVRKLFSKYVGVLYYDLPGSPDPESPMYDNILGPADLDRMQEPLPVSATR